MRRVDRLKKEARESAKFREHTLGYFYRNDYWHTVHAAYCKICGMAVAVDSKRIPYHGIEIWGEGVALTCPKKREEPA